MADARQQSTRASQVRFLVRIAGALAALAVILAALLVRDDIAGDGDASPRGAVSVAAYAALVAGLVGVVIWGAFELAGLVKQSTGRRAAVGTNLALQIALAVLLLVIVNAVSFVHHGRADATRDKRFTLAPELKERLRKLNPNAPTKVVVLQRGKTATIEPDNPGPLESAAEAKVVEKVRDLVDELRELGPRFQVTVLATRDEDFDAALAKLTRELPAREGESPDEAARRTQENRERDRLRAAIQAAPENSVFFAANGRVQRLGFNQFYMLDKTASLSRDNPDGRNLVLVPQGKAAFVGKVLALEEKTPKVALLTIHPLLSTQVETGDEYTAAGVRRALEKQGYDVTDVLLKRWSGRGTPPAAADSFAEKTLGSLERSLPAAQLAAARYEATAESVAKLVARIKSATIPEINALLRGRLPRNLVDEEDRRTLLESLVSQEEQVRDLGRKKREELAKSEAEYNELLKDDRAVESLRNQDVRAKLRGYVRDCDVLVVPRLTTMQLSARQAVPGWLHSLNKDQADVIREFMAAGKPVLFAMGPVAADTPQPNETSNDDVERMLARLGIDLGTDAIITDAEVKATADPDEELSVPADPIALGIGLRFSTEAPPGKAANPVAAAYLAAAHSVDADTQGKAADPAAKPAERSRLVFSVARTGGYRSVTVSPAVAAGLAYAPEILRTVEKSWNDAKPLREEGYVPAFDPPKPDDPKKGGREDEVMKAYSVGVALETRVPAEWKKPELGAEKVTADTGALAPVAGPFPPGLAVAAVRTPDDLAADPAKPLRVIVYGHGGLFIGKTLDPARETLLLNSLDWLLDRGDRLPHDLPEGEKWRYPRVASSPAKLDAVATLTAAGPSLVAAFFGILVLMARRFR